MKKHLWLALTLVLGMSMILAACGNSDNGSSSGNDTSKSSDNSSGSGNKMPKVTLNVTTTFGSTDPGRKAYDSLLEKFKEQHPNVSINRNDFTAKEATNTKYETSWNGGNIPDLVFYFVGQKAKFMYDSGKMVPMSKIQEANPDWAANLNPAALGAVKTLAPSGKLYAIPLVGYYEGLIVNKKLFKDNGLELPTTWDNLTKAIDTFKKKDIIPITASMNDAIYLFEHFVLGSGGAECHAKGLKDDIPDCYVKGLDLIKKTYDMGAYSKDTMTLPDDNAAQNYYQKGQAAMLLDGSWAVGALPEDVANNSTVLALPTPPDSTGYDGKQLISGFSSGWYISKDAYNGEKKKAAVAFLKFMTSPEADEAFANGYGAVPSIKGVNVNSATNAAKDGFALAQDASALEPASDGFISEKVFNYIRDNIPSVVTGKTSSKDLLTKAQGLEK